MAGFSSQKPWASWERIREWRARYPYREIALFFSLGFLFDVVTLDRIDSRVNIAMHAGYLLVLGGLILLELRHALGQLKLSETGARLWQFGEDILHFLLGSLLSSFSLFYFKSASGLATLFFMAAMFGLLLVNELPQFRRLGHVARLALFSFCLTSFFGYLYPTLLGFLSAWLFVLAVATSLLVGGFFSWLVWRWSRDGRWVAGRVGLPFVGVQGFLLAVYFLGAIPPLPVSVQEMGIYHRVERLPSGEFQLHHQQPRWKFWHSGDTDFQAREGDRIYMFARVFAPTHFQERIRIRWEYDAPKRGWVEQGNYSFTITGGRDKGFRGYAYKENYQPGAWRVFVETSDGRVIGKMSFSVTADSGTAPRDFVVEPG